MGTAQTQIFPPGLPSHMDHIQSLSSSIDVVGPEKGWGYSDDPTNFSYLDQDYNVNTKLNYDLQTTHQLGRLADQLRQDGYGKTIPPNLTQQQLGDPKRQRLTQKEAISDLIIRSVRPDTAEKLDYALKLIRQAEAEQVAWSGRKAV